MIHEGTKKIRIPVYELGHKVLNVHLADQMWVTLTECLLGVDIESDGEWIKTDLWVHDDLEMEDISLGKPSMERLGFALRDRRGRNIWTTQDPLQNDPSVTAFLNQWFGCRGSSGANGHPYPKSGASAPP